jgi:hypothetical protein
MSGSRYDSFIVNGKMKFVPFIPIAKQNTDYYVVYDAKKMRMDTLSYDYYGDANYGWLIMQANPEYGSLEFHFPDKCLLRIPFPLENALNNYVDDLELYKIINGE